MGSEAIQLSDEQGKFEIAVLPGPGRLLVRGPQGKHVLQQVSESELHPGKSNGKRVYAHAIERIDPTPGADPIELSFSLRPGATIVGALVDETGARIDEANVISPLNIAPNDRSWDRRVMAARDGKFELTGLDRDQDYRVSFFNPQLRLGATQVFRADTAESSVILKPCGGATVRYVDSAGHPQAETAAELRIVVAPGVAGDDWAFDESKLASATDLITNAGGAFMLKHPKTDGQGRITFPALIPGTTYRLVNGKAGRQKTLKEFSVGSGEQLDLGDVSLDR